MNPARAAEHFLPSQQITDIRRHGSGNVNDTFLVEARSHNPIILQRLNDKVFPHPQLIMRNLRLISDHLAKKSAGNKANGARVPAIIPTLAGDDFHIDTQGALWRALEFITNADTFATITDLSQAQEAGAVLGRFHGLIADIAPPLHDTLPGFHITPDYLRIYDEVAGGQVPAPAPEIDYCRDFIAARRDQASVLEQAKACGKLIPRPIHADPKLNNIMFDKISGKAICLIDLDTVKQGLIHYDIADLLRSTCNNAGEEAEPNAQISFDLDICRAALGGYINAAGPTLTSNDRHYLGPAIGLLPFELGLRFYTDYLAGNIYFHSQHPQQNLHRAITQFRLLADIERKQERIAAIIADLH